MKQVTLYRHQKELVELAPKKHLLAWETGTGKSLTAIKLAELTHKSSLVICPKSLKVNWQKEIKKFSIIQNFSVLTKEEFKKQATSLSTYDVLIIDEAHYFAGMKSQMSKSLLGYIKKHKSNYIYLLTATPYMSTPWNIYVLSRYLGVEWNYQKFKYHFFNDVQMGHRMIPVIKKGIEPTIARLVQRLGSTKKLSECIDVPDSIFLTEYFDLTKEQERGMEELEASVPIVFWTKCHQICGGTLKNIDKTKPHIQFKSEKLARVCDLANEHDKIAIICRYNAEIANIKQKLEKKKGFKKPIYVIQGATTQKDDVVNSINSDKECVVLIQSACSEGYNMPGVPIMVFYSYDFSLKNYIQMRGRIQRINAVQKCVYISLIVKGTVDEDVYKSVVVHKQDFQIAIYAKYRAE